MLQDIIAKDRELIPYRKELNKLTGSVTATLFLTQVIYWWNKNGKKPFYKFRSECNHIDYRKGDSWCEELGFSEKELDYAMSLVCAKQNAKRKDAKSSLKENLVKPYVICKIDMNRKTYYSINEELLEHDLNMLYGRLGNVPNGDYVNYETEITKSTKGRLDIYTENTTETTNRDNIAQNKFERISLSDNNSLAEIKETNISTAKQKKNYAADFETFCNAYPNKLGKSKSEQKFAAAVKKIGFEKLLQCVENYKQFVAEERKKNFPNLAYMHLSTFINGRFEDFLPNIEKQTEIDNSPKYKGISLATEVNYSIAGGTSSKVEFGKFLANCVRYQNNLHNYSYNGGNKISLNEINEIKDLLQNTKYLQ